MGSTLNNSSQPVGSYRDTGIDVLIVGTGLAGLTAAIECVRKGHRVQVLERHEEISTMGDMYFMGLSGTRFFKHWPDMAREYDEISLHDCWMETFKHSGECMIPLLKVAERLKEAGLDPDTPPGAFQMRPLVYRMFVNQVERLGIEVLFGKRVVKYFENGDKAGVETEHGETFEADMVIAADGVGSKSQEIVGGQVRAASSGRAMWRAAFPVSHLDQDPQVKEFFQLKDGHDPVVRTFLGPGTYGLTLTRDDVMVWIINHDATGDERESWHHTVEADDVLANMDKSVVGTSEGWAPIFKQLVRITPPKTIVNFELFWRNPQPSWCSPTARIVQIGDAAHSFLPSSGNGATQAIEDAVSLASCLHLGGSAKTVPESVRAHIRFRFLRCACAQKLGFLNAERLQATNWDKAKLDPRKAQPKHPRWVWSHDPETYAHDNYDRCIESMRNHVPMDQDDVIPPNYPPGYKYVPWNIDEIMANLEKGIPVQLGSGNWE
ncbi:uncharacterized protein BCR38DRAFT_330092 [Pseudomassariella vexata]|uniref:Uncharacterized protein n=1 Tax=Pseudomassariella vexata TaxID=1141098 RepID=A0A1Y2EIW5_9PEZI|nr:uncharacterized protein BCR38DRAFT_330092 [Pseudomassariella vexata]ORY71532.1 hypothetical protein BCR38DRAFT_330092 [Pseudomassariella vexata]